MATSYDTKCPECGRVYIMDTVLGKLVETIPSEKIKRPHCDHCQK